MTRTLLGLGGVALVGTLAVLALISDGGTRNEPLSTAVRTAPTNPLADRARPHLDHSAYFNEAFTTPQEVTKACLSCHEDAAEEVMKTPHWLWLSGDVERDGKLVRTGKRNLMNNFCISTSGNQASCSRCHAGYGMADASYDFTIAENVDCLVCHDGSGSYSKGKMGLPGEKVDLRAVASSVRMPQRENCGICHFNGGGGMGVKHGDLDDSLINATDSTDVHMGRLNFQCVDCHETHDHAIPGKINATYTSATAATRFDCTECHDDTPHPDAQLNKHVARVACQTCHIPAFARKYATKMEWDWSQAGDSSRKDDPHEYLKIKGAFQYEDNVRPQYAWYNGRMDRYITGDKLTADPQVLNQPLGSRDDPTARIFPFKVHRARQIFDPVNRVLIPPITSGEGGFWTSFDWDFAAREGMKTAGLPYSGSYDFTETVMYWPINHMTTPAEEALACTECHAETGRLDWTALGYERDPAGGKSDAE